MGKFYVWAVCKPCGAAVAYVEWGGRGEFKAHKLAEALTARDNRLAGKFFVQRQKVERDEPLAHAEPA